LALAERAGIDPVIYRGEDEDEADEVALLGTKFEEEKIQGMKQFLKSGKVPAQTLTPEMIQTIEQLPVDDSLMAQVQQQEEVPAQDTGSLLAPPAPTEEEMQ